MIILTLFKHSSAPHRQCKHTKYSNVFRGSDKQNEWWRSEYSLSNDRRQRYDIAKVN